MTGLGPALGVLGADAELAPGGYYNPPSDVEVVRGEGVYLYTSDGARLLDCAAGTFNLSLGYSHPAVVRAAKDQVERLVHVTSRFRTPPTDALVERLVEISPPNLARVHLKSSGGSTAVEGAIKIAQRATGRDEVVTLFRSHHGQTLAMTAISGDGFRRTPHPGLNVNGVRVPDPYCYRCFYRAHPDSCGLLCVDRINDLIDHAGSGRVACMVVEPISGSGGNVVPPPGYLKQLMDLCGQRGIILIFDEVQTGFGRTGEMFAADYFGVSPHLLALGKGMGAGLPIAAILAEERLQGLDGTAHAFTNGGNILSAAVALAVIDEIRAPGFLENVRATGAYILDRLRDMGRRYRAIGDVRGIGLMLGLELVDRDGEPDSAVTNHLIDRAIRHGLVLRGSQFGRGNVLKIRPPLVITEDEAAQLCDLLDDLFNAEL